MKFSFVLLALVVLTFAATKKHFKKHNTTPKAYHLHNHYGASPYASPYGPRPRLVKREYTHIKEDGTEEKKVFAHVDSLPPALQNKFMCDITTSQDFQICFGITDCDLCNSSPHCGWCNSRNACLPGDLNGVTCPNACFHGWIFAIEECTNKVKSGKLSNVAPDAIELIDAKYAEPIAEIKTKLITPTVVKTPVLLGNKVINTEVKNSNPLTGEVYNSTSYIYEQPITGVVHQIMNVENEHIQHINLNTGKRIAHENNKAKFGVENN